MRGTPRELRETSSRSDEILRDKVQIVGDLGRRKNFAVFYENLNIL